MNKWTRGRRSHRGKPAVDGEKKEGEAEETCVKQKTIWIWEKGKQGIDKEGRKEET